MTISQNYHQNYYNEQINYIGDLNCTSSSMLNYNNTNVQTSQNYLNVPNQFRNVVKSEPSSQCQSFIENFNRRQISQSCRSSPIPNKSICYDCPPTPPNTGLECSPVNFKKSEENFTPMNRMDENYF